MNKHLLRTTLLAAAGLIAGATTATAQDATYGPWDGTQDVTYWGTNKKESYDVAIHITDAALVGKTVKGIVIPFDTDVSGIEAKGAAFLTKALNTKNAKDASDKTITVNDADVETDSFDVKAGNVTITFAQPYTITADGIYVGYSVTPTGTDAIIPAIAVSTVDPENVYIRSTRTYKKWKSRESLGFELAIQVLVGGLDPDVASVTSTGDINTQVNTPTNYTFNVNNQGSTEISSVDYTYTVAGQSGTNHYDFATPVSRHINASGSVTFTLPEFTEQGKFPLTITLDKVNGKANTSATATATANITAYKVLPTKRALLEEYTGTWCGYCPRGFVGLEHMNELLGNDFVGVSYHNDDPMEFTDDYLYASFPTAWIDRAYETDAYCGDTYDGHFNIDKTYAEHNKQFGVADLATVAYFPDDSKSTIKVKTAVTFPLDEDDNAYQLSYILTADGLSEAGDSAHQSNWDQSNYYSGQGSSYPDDDMKEFTSGGSAVKGLTYNFVVCGLSGIGHVSFLSSYGVGHVPASAPIDGSLPTSVKGEQPIDYSYEFDLSKAVNTSGNDLIQDKSKLHVITLLVNTKTGAVANALKSDIYENAALGIKGIEDSADNTALGRQYFSIDGKRLAQPQKGLNIVRMSNGKTFKAYVK